MNAGPDAGARADAGDDAVIRLTGLARSFGAVQAVRGVDLEIRRGEMFGFIGPDGAGKTSTLRMIAGLLEPGGGHVETLGLDPRRDRRACAGAADSGGVGLASAARQWEALDH